MTIDPKGTVDPQTNLQNYIDQWKAAKAQYDADYANLVAMIQNMLNLAKKGGNGVQEAFQIAEMCVMPATTQVQGDTMGTLAATMNISSACLEFATDTQNDINGGANMTPAQAADFVKNLQAFYLEIQAQANLPDKDPNKWMDTNTANNILSSISQMCKLLGDPASPPPSDPSGLNPAWVQFFINNWNSNPSGTSNQAQGGTFPNPNGANGMPLTGQQCLQNLQSGFTQWNNSVSAQSQGLQAQEQFAANTFNQYLNTCTDIFKSTQQQDQNMIQNQKAQ